MYFDPISGGSCWRCPSGYQRTAVKRDTAQAQRYADLGLKAAAVAGEGKNTADRFNELVHCRP